jgi:uncharacterized protein (TIGR02996 family)
MTDEQTRAAFLQSILANPSDDAVRLIFANWLEEQGEGDRGEFIRVQCELAKPPPGGTEWKKLINRELLKRRERELLATHGALWSAELADMFCGTHNGTIHPHHHGYEGCMDGAQWKWRRGFVSAVTCTAADFLRHADAMTASQPIEEVTLTTMPEIQFGPVRETSGPGIPEFGGTAIYTRWLAYVDGQPPLKFGMQLDLDKEAALRGMEEYMRQDYAKRIESARTPLGYLRIRWPRIKFTLPALTPSLPHSSSASRRASAPA